MQKSMDLRFLRKILTDTEIEQVLCSDRPDAVLWSFWACKEAAYKVFMKQTSDAIFIPRRWSVRFCGLLPAAGQESVLSPCSHKEDWTAGDVVIAEEKIVAFRLSSGAARIHCLAADRVDVLERVVWRVESLPEGRDENSADASAWARSRLADALAVFIRGDRNRMDIRRNARRGGELEPPAVYFSGVKTDIDISLSHDGRFVAYAFLP